MSVLVGIDGHPFKVCRRERGESWREKRRAVFKAQQGLCAVCGEAMSRRMFEVDHKLALCCGGCNDMENLQAVHHECHVAKHEEDSACACELSAAPS